MSRVNSRHTPFRFTSKPTVAAAEWSSNDKPKNIMHDRRVVRGNTYSRTSLPDEKSLAEMAMLREVAKRRKRSSEMKEQRMRYNTPWGRQDTLKKNQTDLVYDVLEEAEAGDACEEAPCRPPTPEYVPAWTSKSKGSQVQAGDLFEFDVEVKPMVEAIVGRVLQQSHDEVVEEEELAEVRERRKQFEVVRNGEMADLQWREEQDRRIREEVKRRRDQKDRVAALEQKKAEDLKIKESAREYIDGLLPSVFKSLENSGYFYDSFVKDFEENLKIEEQAVRSRDAANLSRIVLDVIIREAVLARREVLKTYPPNGQMISDSDSCHGKECCDFIEELTGEEESGRGEGVTFDENVQLLKSHSNLDAPSYEYPGETFEVPVFEKMDSIIEEENDEEVETVESF